MYIMNKILAAIFLAVFPVIAFAGLVYISDKEYICNANRYNKYIDDDEED